MGKEEREYAEIGKVLDELAGRRKVKGPYRVGKFVYETTGRGPKTNKKG